MDYLLYNARESGFRDVTIVVGPNDDSIRSAYGREERDNLFAGLRISYATQPVPPGRTKPLGTADALHCALRARADWRGERFVVCNSDNLYSIRAFRALAATVHPSAMIDYDRSALEFEASRVEKFTVVQKDPLGFLRSIVEKPGPAEIAAAADRTWPLRSTPVLPVSWRVSGSHSGLRVLAATRGARRAAPSGPPGPARSR